MKKSARKGFTLVELLIVIVVIGILSAMMMLSSTEAVSSAKAADIISDLRNLKTAALAFYADNLDKVDKSETGYTFEDANKDKILKYFGTVSIDSNYTLVTHATTKEWYVGRTNLDSKVAEKLDARKGSVGLTATTNSSDTATIATAVYMFVK